jgi:hypothetical protein
MRRLLIALAALLAFAGTAGAHDYTVGDLTIDHPWATPSIPGQGQASAYLVVRNAGGEADRLVGARASIAEGAALHGHVMDGDVARMSPVEALDVPPRGEAALEPGGAHVMLVGLAEPLALEDSFVLTLTFERAGDVDVEVKVQSLAEHLSASPAAQDAHAGH